MARRKPSSSARVLAHPRSPVRGAAERAAEPRGARSQGAKAHVARRRMRLPEIIATLSVVLTGLILIAVGIPQGWYLPAPDRTVAMAPAAETPAASAGITVQTEEPVSAFARTWRVHLSDKATGKPVSDANVVLKADHTAMPGSHPQGPLQMQHTGVPGEFRATVGPLMYGDWVVDEHVTGSVTGSKQWTETITPGGAAR